jgi:hypothetical protein
MSGKRVQTALIVESGEIREVMHAALLLGYGASALCPYMTYAILDDLVKKGKIQENYATAEANYIGRQEGSAEDYGQDGYLYHPLLSRCSDLRGYRSVREPAPHILRYRE